MLPAMNNKIYIFIALLSLQAYAGLPEWCLKFFDAFKKSPPVVIEVPHVADVKDFTNLTLAMKPEDYPQEAGRGQAELASFFGDGFDYFVNTLNKKDLTVDVGAGYGLFGLRLARSKNRTIAISAHNMWGVLEQIAKLDPKKVNLEAETKDPFRVLKFNNLNQEVINSLASLFKNNKLFDAEKDFQIKAGGFFYAKASKYDPNQGKHVLDKKGFIKKFIEAAKSMVHEKEVFKDMHYIVGNAEDILPTSNYQAKLLVDCYGASFYQVDVPAFLELYDKNLKIGGRAYVYFYTSSMREHERRLFVRTKRGLIPLEDYLPQKFPKTFEKHIQRSETGLSTTSLVMYKNSQSSLNLGLKVDESSIKMGEKNAIELIFDEVN
jgi:hypothetical protein